MVKRPCDECPFRKTMGYLNPGRARELARNAASWDGVAFWCHKTIQKATGSNSTARHCAGSAAFSEKIGVQTQALRIAERLQMYKPEDVTEYLDEIYDSIDDMEEGHARS